LTNFANNGLVLHRIFGTGPLPLRLGEAHTEIRAGSGMTRGQFKKALQELE